VKVEHPGNAQPCSIGINNTLTGPRLDCEATFSPPAGKCRNVVRILFAVVLLALLVTGCGSSSPRADRSASRGVPRVLASEWESRAGAVADAAAAGDNCRALRLASSLRDDVIAKASRVPPRLQSPLLAGVNALADRIVCQVTAPSKKPPRPKPPHKHEDHHHHHEHGDKEGEG
jgi:hypothetical protein